MFTNALRIFTLRGVDIRIDASWLFIAAIVTWSFWGQFRMIYDQDALPAFVMAVVGALLFFSSVLAHEVAHAMEAQRRGVSVGGITLFMFGGVTESKFDVRRPVDEFSLTIVGPLTSFLLAGVFWGATTAATGAELPAVAQVTGLLGWINLALGVFNLIPGAPLDGGRVLRAAIWKATGDRQRSIRWAAQAGRVVGAALIALGVLQVLAAPGGLFGGLWIALIGWFLTRGAAAELAQVELMEQFEGLNAGSLAVRASAVQRDQPVDDVLERWLSSDAPDLLPVEDRDRLVGLVSIDDIEQVADERRHRTPVEAVMRPLDEFTTLDADAPARGALDAVQDGGTVVVTDHDHPVGLITPQGLALMAERRRRVAGRHRPAPPRGPRRHAHGATPPEGR